MPSSAIVMAQPISVVIPARNESAALPKLLDSFPAAGDEDRFELIVVDNCSEDDTVRVAVEHGARVVRSTAGTVAAVRNAGVVEATGDVLVFLDADVLLDPSWFDRIGEVASWLRAHPMTVTGSRCLPTETSGFLFKYWFDRLASTRSRYVNTGHMITTRACFDRIEGFRPDLVSAEDHDFCERVLAVGGTVEPRAELVARHPDYPTGLSAFVRRERWHGRADFSSLENLLRSRVALMVLAHAVLLATCLVIGVAGAFGPALLSYVGGVVLGALLAVHLKFGPASPSVLVGSGLAFVLYLWGRTLAAIDAMRARF